jgi:serine/threonine protein kinase
MLMANGYFKLIDFGLVRTDRVDPKSTAIAGTPLYFAPEVLKKESTKLSDLWALGVFAYELFFL